MDNDTIEYGYFQENDEYDSACERNLLTGLIGCGGFWSMCSGNYQEALMLISTIPLIWWREVKSLFQPKNTIRERVLLLGSKLTQLPAPDLSDYDRTKLGSNLEYFDEVLEGTSFIKSCEELLQVDPRVNLVIDNKITEDSPFPYRYNIRVTVSDPIWNGFPSENTMITGVVFN